MKWHLRYQEGLRGEPSDSLRLGRLIDATAAAFWRRDDWRSVLAEQIVEQGFADFVPELDFLDEVPELEVPARAYWLMQRYERHYGPMLAQVEVLGEQVDLTAPIPGTSQKHQAIIDHIWRVEGDVWVVERKTYGRADRTALVEVDPQLTNNLWVARANGYDAVGIIWDGIYTYRWRPEKPTQKQVVQDYIDQHGEPPAPTAKGVAEWAREAVERHSGIERPDSDSFEMLFLDRHDAHIQAAHRELQALVSRRTALRRGAQPTRNIGPLCKACEQRETCFERLAFPQSIEVAS
jgi:hypothetical protein